MSNLDRLPTTARVYVEGAPTIHLSGDDAFTGAQRQMDSPIIVGVTTDGERVAIKASRVIDIVEPNPEVRVQVQDGIFFGRKVEIRSLQALRRDGYIDPAERWDYPDESIAVYAEDLSGTIVLLMDSKAERVLWDNPANEDGVSKRYQRAVRALAEAESLMVQAYEDADAEKIRKEQDPTHEDNKNADAHLEAGNVQAAISIANAEYVAEFLRSGPADRVIVRLQGGDEAEVTSRADGAADEITVNRFGASAGYETVNVHGVESVRFVDHADTAE